MRAIGHHHFAEGRDRGAQLSGPRQHAGRSPFRVAAMGRGHVFGHRHMAAPAGTARMAGDACPAMEDLDDGTADPDIDLLPDQPERHGIPRGVELDVIVGRDAGPLPAGERVGLRGQRLQVRPVEGRKQIGAAGIVAAHDAHVQLVQKPPDCDVQIGQREEAQVAQPRQNPALSDLYSDLHLRLVTRLVGTRGQDGGTVMSGHLGIGPVQPRIEAVSLEHR